MFGIITSCQNTLVNVVHFNVIFFTVHEISPISIKSQITYIFENNIENEAKRSAKMFCKAKATAIEATHKLATNGVKLTQILLKNNNIQSAQTTIFTINSAAFFHAGFQCNAFQKTYEDNFTIILAAQKIMINKNIALITLTAFRGNTNIFETINKTTKSQNTEGNFATAHKKDQNLFHSLFSNHFFNLQIKLLVTKSNTTNTITAKNILRKVLSNITIFQKL